MTTRKIKYLPLGTRFRYVGNDPPGSIWVLLERHEYGKCAKWEGVNGWIAGQSICSITETPDAPEFDVEVVEEIPDGCGGCTKDHGCTWVDGWACEKDPDCEAHKADAAKEKP